MLKGVRKRKAEIKKEHATQSQAMMKKIMENAKAKHTSGELSDTEFRDVFDLIRLLSHNHKIMSDAKKNLIKETKEAPKHLHEDLFSEHLKSMPAANSNIAEIRYELIALSRSIPAEHVKLDENRTQRVRQQLEAFQEEYGASNFNSNKPKDEL